MADKNISNPLEELYTDNRQVDTANLLSILKPFIRLHKETGTVIFTPLGISLSANKKIVLLFLAKKALFLLGVIASEPLAPKDVKLEFGKNIPPGTIDAALKRFSEKGPLRGQDGKYFIPDFNLPQVQEMFSKFNDK
jgi:hypothetical protein